MYFNREIIQLLRQSIQAEGWLDFPSVDFSMFLLIQKGDICRYVPCELDKLSKGDIVLVWTSEGRLLPHCFSHVVLVSGKPRYVCKGDTLSRFDEAVQESRIIGKLMFIKRRKRRIRISLLPNKLWGKLVLSVPAVSKVLHKLVDRRELPLES